ncbi:DUF397 domain-containing protein [Streptomyces roseirectus]|uniref:DUF397 domain-containing protein n=1 Tax=Streptomyces roseirectus TaxID=2768066 RepID=A0A7H0IH41_9ACTN|nr:DUF397 domain-containing protein [Streptomyces roseirectus]QNP72107.1 DUF397 domain-containing protein [Streptomyces roseirectus]
MTTYEFRTAAACGGPCSEGCLEVATNVPGIVALRDTKTGTVMQFTPQEWADFLTGAKSGEFDLGA